MELIPHTNPASIRGDSLHNWPQSAQITEWFSPVNSMRSVIICGSTKLIPPTSFSFSGLQPDSLIATYYYSSGPPTHYRVGANDNRLDGRSGVVDTDTMIMFSLNYPPTERNRSPAESKLIEQSCCSNTHTHTHTLTSFLPPRYHGLNWNYNWI